MPSTSPSSRPPEFRFFQHRDYGLLRERAGELQFDMWDPEERTWQRILMNPFTASMSVVPEAAAAVTAGGELLAPIAAREVSPGVVEPA